MAKAETHGDTQAKTKASKHGGRTPTQWSIHRYEEGVLQRCAWHEGGVKQEAWPMPPPTAEQIRDRWGSGKYRLTFMNEKGAVRGNRAVPVIDDPEHPPKPVYPNPPRRRPPAEEAPAPKPTSGHADPVAALLASLGGTSAQSVVQAMLQGIGLYQQLDMTNRRFAQSEADARVARMQAEAEMAIARDRAYWEAQSKAQAAFFDRLLSATRQPDEDMQARLDELEEELEERETATGADNMPLDPKRRLLAIAAKKLEDVPPGLVVELLQKLAGKGGAS